MTYDRAHYYVTFGGGFSSVETWQTGIRFAPVLGNPSNSESTLLNQLEAISVLDILEDVTTVIRDGIPPYASGVNVRWAKVAVINQAGHYAGDPKLAEQAPIGGAAGAGLPWVQLAWCVSLWSGENHGHANRGRMYMPMPNQIAPNILTGQVDPPSHVNSFRTGMKDMIDAIRGEVATIAVDVRPAIMSKLGAGQTKTIKYVGVGPVIDTIRSRREALDDTVKTWALGWD